MCTCLLGGTFGDVAQLGNRKQAQKRHHLGAFFVTAAASEQLLRTATSYDKSFDSTKARSTSIASSLKAHQALLIGSSGDSATPITWRPSFQ